MSNNSPDSPIVVPAVKSAIAFFDAQNLYNSAVEAFRVREVDFDPVLLTKHVCDQKGLTLKQIRFYTGLPGANEQPRLHKFWSAKLRRLRNQQVDVSTLPVRYRYKEAELPLTNDVARWARLILPDGSQLPRSAVTMLDGDGRQVPVGTVLSVQVGEEKGIDVRLALDCVRLTRESAFDVGILFTQDQDHAETVKESLSIARSQGRAISFLSVFPSGCRNDRGVNGAEAFRISESVYKSCIDKHNYWPK